MIGGKVRFDSYTRHLFSRDASMYAIEPIGVVFPRDAADVAAVVTTARDFGVPVLPRGAGTSLVGQTLLAMLRTVTGESDMGAATVDRFVDRRVR